VGLDAFTFAAYDGSKNSSLATGSVTVVQGSYSLTAVAQVPPAYPAGWPAPFAIVATPINTAASVAYDWDFGDGSVHSVSPFAAHAYTSAGPYHWRVTASVGSASFSTNGTISISAPVLLASTYSGAQITVAWPRSQAETLLEASPVVGPGATWTPVTNAVTTGPESLNVTVPSSDKSFFRVRRPW
jgi:PKD repeat protein